jgi:hypothetical protein
MIKIYNLFVVTLIVFIMAGCTGTKEELNTSEKADIYLNGTLLSLSQDNLTAIIKQTDNLLAEGDVSIEINNTSETIRKLKSSEQFLEIDFHAERYIITDKYGKIEFQRILIPLSGPFTAPEQLSIFYGEKEYSQMSMVRNTRYHDLNKLLIRLDSL